MRAFLLLFVCLLATMSAGQLTPTERIAHGTTLEISQYVLARDSRCSATAIGPHAILTASHCELPTDRLFVEGHKEPVTITARLRDDLDHTIYLINGLSFDNYAVVNLTPLVQGEPVFMFGNPGTWSDILRRGFVAGREHRFPIFQILYSFESDHGDSGSGVFDKDGKLVAVVSRLEVDGDEHITPGMSAAASFPLAFTDSDLQKARSF